MGPSATNARVADELLGVCAGSGGSAWRWCGRCTLSTGPRNRRKGFLKSDCFGNDVERPLGKETRILAETATLLVIANELQDGFGEGGGSARLHDDAAR